MPTEAPSPRDIADITGLVLAGGRGSRLGGVDKGLQSLRGEPIVVHTLRRLRPQVGRMAINANRHIDTYAAQGLPVWPDLVNDQPGPLAGLLTGLRHCETPWLLTVPCDTPRFPANLVERLVDGLRRATDHRPALTMAVTRTSGGPVTPQPVFLLAHRSLTATVDAALQRGEHRIGRWVRDQCGVEVAFDDPSAFFNLNTPEDFAAFEQASRPAR